MTHGLLPHFVHILLPLGLAGDPSDSALLPSILSILKILPSYQPISVLLTMTATHFHSMQDYSAADNDSNVLLGIYVRESSAESYLV